MEVGVFNMSFMQNEFSGIGMRLIWSEENRVQKILEVERALAIVEAKYGLIPQDKAQLIDQHLHLAETDWRKIRLSYARSGHFVSGLVKYFEEILPDHAGDYLHFGSTTQDILDTGMILQLKEAHKDTKKRAWDLIRAVAKQAREQANVITVGRVHGQIANPILLGHQLAIYLEELMDLYEELDRIEDKTFYSAISGVVGTYAGYGYDGLSIAEKVADKLGLNFDPIGWHTRRERLVDYMHLLAKFAGVIGKAASNLVNLARTEIDEYEESYRGGRQGSTAVPTLRCPYLNEATLNLAHLVHNEMNLMYQSMLVTHEKDTIAWRNQWVAIPAINMYLSCMFNYLTSSFNNGRFKQDQIAKNLAASGGKLQAEKLMNTLATRLGKHRAHELVYELGNASVEENADFVNIVKQNQEVNEILSAEELKAIFKPENGLGASKILYQKVMGRYDDLLAKQKETNF